MIERFRNIWTNVGPYQFARTLLSMIFLVVVPVLLSRNGSISPTILAPIAFMIAWAFRMTYIKNIAVTMRALQIGGFLLFGLFVAWVLFRSAIPMSVASAAFVFFGLYLGVYFWFLSDPILTMAMRLDGIYRAKREGVGQQSEFNQ